MCKFDLKNLFSDVELVAVAVSVAVGWSVSDLYLLNFAFLPRGAMRKRDVWHRQQSVFKVSSNCL